MSVQLINVSHIYAQGTPFEFAALKDIHFSIDKDEFIGIIGHTGSGKSTLIQHLNGLLSPTEGSVVVDGVKMGSSKGDKLALRRKVGLVFQYAEHQLFEETVFKDIAFGPKNLGLSEEEIENRVRDAMEVVGLDFETYKERSPFELSGGQMRRVAIAGVLSMKPEILILDEPTAGLDPYGKEDILRSVYQLHERQKTTVVLVSHNMDEVARLANRVIVMSSGEILMDAPPAEVFTQVEKLNEIGLGAPDIICLMRALKKAGMDVDDQIFRAEQAKEEILRALKRGEGAPCSKI
ncbi:MAG: energy-coupling factor transporter ATPase [Eubacteriaceae bacterium]|jgi:energy-coupling factor transport system ATP-binding protein|nr:energy-coupling factor transporter ATPase [Eubacteriaceae bacterium]